MSPAQRRPSRRLPLSSQQLAAFDKARTAETISEKRTAVNAIVSASFSNGVSMKTDAARYVLNRLLNAISVSGNHTRLNSSSALVAFIRTLRKVDPKSTEQQVISAILRVYGSDGSFEVDYASGERERAIGTITACAAFVRAYDGKLQPATCKEIVSLLRPCVAGNCAKWQLGRSCVHIVTEFLRGSGSSAVQDACAKSLWQWCEERKNFDDGLSLVLNLLQLNIASHNAIKRIYPDLDSMATALASTFETGFSYRSGDLEGADLVPLAWKLALSYSFSPDGQSHLGGPEKFWKRVVVEGLIHSGGSVGKKILALEMLQLAVPRIKDESTFDIFFDSSISSLIRIIRSNGKTRRDDAVVKGVKFGPKGRQNMNQSLSRLEGSIAKKVLESSPNTEVSNSFLQLFFSWGVRNGVIAHVLSPSKLNEVLRSINIEDIHGLFCRIINEFVCPKDEKNRLSVPEIRMQAKGFAFKLANLFPYLVDDTVRIFLFYAVCDDSCYQSLQICEGKVVKFAAYKPPSSFSLVCNLFPVPSPPISVAIASSVFSKVIGFISEIHNRNHQATLVSFCYDHLKHMLLWKGVKLRTQNDLEDGDEGMVSSKQKLLETVVEPVFASLSKARENGKKGLIDALQLLTGFIGLLLLKPSLGSKTQVENGFRDHRFCISLAHEIFQIASLLQDDIGMDVDKEGGVENEEKGKQPDATERIAKLLCDICIRSDTVPHQIALRVIDEMNSSVDDRVVAVLFDVMEEVLQSRGTLADSPQDEDSDEAEEGKDLTSSDDSDSDESTSETQIDDKEPEEIQRDVSLSEPDEETANVNSMEVASVEESEPESEIDMDIDDEDPNVLEALDKHLVAHMKLVQEEKNSTTRRKRGSRAKFYAVRRILSVVEEVAKGLRLRLASNKDDGRTGIIFLDLQCRLYEFAMSDMNYNGQFLASVCNIISKQMLLPLSILQDKVADGDTAREIADRFLNSLCVCKVERSLSASEVQTISKSVACVVGVAAMLSNNNYEHFLPYYQKLVEIMLKTSSPMIRPRMFSSFITKAPSLSLSLFSTIAESLEGTKATKKQLTRGSEIILQLARLTKEQNDNIPVKMSEEFWTAFKQLFRKHCGTGFKGWNASGIDNVIQVILLGSTLNFMVLSDSDMERFLTVVKTKASRRSAQRLEKLWRSTSAAEKPGEPSENASLRPDADQEKMKVSKKRKLK